MSTVSLGRDHDLMVQGIESALQLLSDGTKIPEPFLLQVIDFSNFTHVYYHTKEEKSLFSALEQVGMPSDTGLIAMMQIDHRCTREIGAKMEGSTKRYILSGDSVELEDMKQYVEHIICGRRTIGCL